MGSLSDAAKDTSAAVRAAAITAMAKFGGETVAGIARDAFRKDSSYEVRAAALTTLVQADPGNAPALIAAAITTPSYQDVIQSAAFQAIIQTNDTSAIAAVDAVIGQQEFAATVLAVLGARGNVHAIDAACGAPQRQALRRAPLDRQQFQNTMARVNKPVTLQRLRAAASESHVPGHAAAGHRR